MGTKGFIKKEKQQQHKDNVSSHTTSTNNNNQGSHEKSDREKYTCFSNGFGFSNLRGSTISTLAGMLRDPPAKPNVMLVKNSNSNLAIIRAGYVLVFVCSYLLNGMLEQLIRKDFGFKLVLLCSWSGEEIFI